MTKDEFAERLRGSGYSVVKDEGCIMILSENKDDLWDAKKIAVDCGFYGTFGWRNIHNHEKERGGN